MNIVIYSVCIVFPNSSSFYVKIGRVVHLLCECLQIPTLHIHPTLFQKLAEKSSFGATLVNITIGCVNIFIIDLTQTHQCDDCAIYSTRSIKATLT